MNSNVTNSFITSVLEKSSIDYKDERVKKFIDIKKDINNTDMDDLWEMAIELDALNFTFQALVQTNKFKMENKSIIELSLREHEIAEQLKTIK